MTLNLIEGFETTSIVISIGMTQSRSIKSCYDFIWKKESKASKLQGPSGFCLTTLSLGIVSLEPSSPWNLEPFIFIKDKTGRDDKPVLPGYSRASPHNPSHHPALPIPQN